MEQRLIDGLALYCDLKKLEELARQRYLDTPSDSPAFSTYKAQMNERTSLKEMVSATHTIDPLHALGACYCRECKHCLIDLSDREYHICMRKSATRHRVSPTDFCSYGERGTE